MRAVARIVVQQVFFLRLDLLRQLIIEFYADLAGKCLDTPAERSKVARAVARKLADTRELFIEEALSKK